jgi:hypothetical protein
VLRYLYSIYTDDVNRLCLLPPLPLFFNGPFAAAYSAPTAISYPAWKWLVARACTLREFPDSVKRQPAPNPKTNPVVRELFEGESPVRIPLYWYNLLNRETGFSKLCPYAVGEPALPGYDKSRQVPESLEIQTNVPLPGVVDFDSLQLARYMYTYISNLKGASQWPPPSAPGLDKIAECLQVYRTYLKVSLNCVASLSTPKCCRAASSSLTKSLSWRT